MDRGAWWGYSPWGRKEANMTEWLNNKKKLDMSRERGAWVRWQEHGSDGRKPCILCRGEGDPWNFHAGNHTFGDKCPGGRTKKCGKMQEYLVCLNVTFCSLCFHYNKISLAHKCPSYTDAVTFLINAK